MFLITSLSSSLELILCFDTKKKKQEKHFINLEVRVGGASPTTQAGVSHLRSGGVKFKSLTFKLQTLCSGLTNSFSTYTQKHQTVRSEGYHLPSAYVHAHTCMHIVNVYMYMNAHTSKRAMNYSKLNIAADKTVGEGGHLQAYVGMTASSDVFDGILG